MPLTIAEIKGILKEPTRAKAVIPKARLQESRLRFHSETAISQSDAGRAFTAFAAFVRKLLPDDKYRMFLALFQFPVYTVSLTDQIYTALHKLFDGRNPVSKYDFLSSRSQEDWRNYRSRTLKADRFWQTRGFEAMKNSINSIVIVDLPEQQEGERPEPYFYFLGMENVVDFKNDSGDVFDWIIFETSDGKIAVFDDEYYRVFRVKDGGGRLDIVETPDVESTHGLNYCPARFFWTTPISYSQPLIKKSKLSNFLGKLDMLLFFEVANEDLNLYGRYPIYSVFSTDCDFVNDLTGEYCDGGALRAEDGNYLIVGSGTKPCPVCGESRLNGAGSVIEVDPPNRENEKADLRNPVQITGIDRDSLDYNNEDIERRKAEIYTATTGNHGASINDKSINEDQVKAILQGLETALEEPQRNFENIIKWTDETACLLRYGAEDFQGLSISLGTEHYIMSASGVLELYQMAKDSSFSTTTLDIFEDQYYETKFRNNPEMLQRQIVLNNLDPFRHRSVSDVKLMYEAGQIGYEDYLIKANFSSFIMRFERENVPVTEFGTSASFEAKIKGIQDAFRMYANEMKPKEETSEPE